MPGYRTAVRWPERFRGGCSFGGPIPLCPKRTASKLATIWRNQTLSHGSAGANPVVAREPPKEVKLPSKLKEGAWVGIRGKGPDDPRQPAKLLYVSPLKSRFLFADKRGKTVLECTRADLARRFKMRDLVILAENPDASLFERIINGVMGKLGHAA